MARPHSLTSPLDDRQGHSQGQEWDALRDELEMLLDQVTDQQRRMGGRSRGAANGQAAAATDDRHSRALQSVKRAVDRFHEQEGAEAMSSHTPERLQSAIEQIRASQSRPYGRRRGEAARQDRTTTEGSAPANSNQFENLSNAISAIARKLESLEGSLERRGQSSPGVDEIAQQMEQLTGVVEMLAHSVGEQSHIKRLEGQIAQLAQAVGTGTDLDFDTISQRLDVLSGAFERLTELQAVQSGASEDFTEIHDTVNGINARLDSLGMEQVGHRMQSMQARIEGLDMSGIESCVRSLYDRIDQLENGLSAPDPAVERLSRELAEFTSTLRDTEGPAAGSALVSRVDTLNQRIAELEGNNPSIDALKSELEGLRTAVVGAVEPRFAALESQLGALADRGPDDNALETQLQRLNDKLDRTGQELSTLQSLYAESVEAARPDFSGLADLVAERTQAAISRVLPDRDQNPDREAFDQLEARLSEMLANHAAERPEQDLSRLETGIETVGQRIDRLEATLRAVPAAPVGGAAEAEPADTRDMPPSPIIEEDEFSGAGDDDITSATTTAPRLDPVWPTAAGEGSPGDRNAFSEIATHLGRQEAEDEEEADEFAGAAAPRHPGLDEDPVDAISNDDQVRASGEDRMPRDPNADAPLNAPAWPDPEPEPDPRRIPVPDSLMVDPDDYEMVEHRDIDEDAVAGAGRDKADASKPVDVPRFDADTVAPPPPPESDFAPGGGQSFATDAPLSADQGDTSAQDRQDPSAVSRSTFIAAARRAAQQNNPTGAEAGQNSLIGRALSRFQTGQKDTDTQRDTAAAGKSDLGSAAAAPEVQAETKPTRAERRAARKARKQEAAREREAAKSEQSADDDLDVVESEESFLSRHRRPILLGAAVVAVSLLTLNLVGQRLNSNRMETSSTAPSSENTDTGTGDVSATDTNSARPEAADTAESGAAIDEQAVGSVGRFEPAVHSDIRVIDPTPLPDMPAPLERASYSPDDITRAPDVVPTPPEELGPEGLRTAAANGSAPAQFEIAAIYAEGRAVEQDLASAANWYERAAAQGFAPAAYRLGNMYENGTGVQTDLGTAIHWYEKAAAAGNRMSMHNLASIHAGGGLDEQQFDEAAHWFERAAALGLTDSQFNLGMLHARGLGVPQDLADSYKWFAIAAESGDEDAVRARDDVARSLDAESVSRLQDEVDGWRPRELDIRANFAPIGTWSDSFDPGPAIENAEVIRRVQDALNKLGYDAGTADGMMGPQTTEAISAFEADTGMTESGSVNPRLLAVLGSQPV